MTGDHRQCDCDSEVLGRIIAVVIFLLGIFVGAMAGASIVVALIADGVDCL